MMNQTSFQTPGAPPMMPQNVQLQQQIYQFLQSQPTLPGWQTVFPIERRASNIHQITTQLRLVQTADMTMTRALTVACEFEKREFGTSMSEEAYQNRCQVKLGEIHNARQSQANIQRQRQMAQIAQNQAAQNQAGQQQMDLEGMMPTQNQFQQTFGVPQMPQQNQRPNISIQQHQQMQQQQMQQQRQMQQMAIGNPMATQQQFQNGQPVPNVPQPTPQNPFTREEQTRILQIATEMARDLSVQDRQDLARLAQQMPDERRQQILSRGVNPINPLLHQRATQKFMIEKRNAMQLAQQRNNAGLATGNVQMPQPRPAPQPPLQHPGQQQQPHDQNAAGNVDQILGRQQEALRHQEAGQVVVPASNGQRAVEQQRAPSRVQRTPRQQPQAQFNAGRPMQFPNRFQQQPQPFWNNMQGPPQNGQQNIQQTPQMSAQPPTPNIPNMQGQNQQQPALQGQLGGLNNNIGARTPRQAQGMPTLNQPMDPPGQAQNVPSPRPTPQVNNKAGQGNGRNVQNGPSALQRTASGQPPANQQRQGPDLSMQAMRNTPTMPETLRQHLAKLPDDKRAAFIAQMQAKKEEMIRVQAAENGTSSVQNPQSRLQPPLGLQSGNVNQGGQDLSAQVAPPMKVNKSQQSAPPVTQFTQGNQQPGAPDIRKLTMEEGKRTNFPVSEQQLSRMEDSLYPPKFFNVANTSTRPPDDVRTWRQLKDWMSANAQMVPPGALDQVKYLQRQQFYLVMGEQRAVQAGQRRPMNSLNQQTNAAPPAQMVPPSGNQQPMSAFNGGPSGPVDMSQLAQITVPEIQNVRNYLAPNMRNMNDDQIRLIILRNRQQGAVNAQNQQSINQQQLQYNNMLRAQQAQNQNSKNQRQNQPQQTGPVQETQFAQTSQQGQQGQTTHSMQQRTTSNTKQAGPTNQAPAKQAAAIRAGQGKKRSSNDDVVEISDPKLTQQSRGPGAKAPQKPSGIPQPTPQQLAAMTSQQQAQFQARQNQIAPMNHATNNMLANHNLQPQGPNVVAQASAETGNQKKPLDPDTVRVKQVMIEVHRSLPPRVTRPMSPKTRGRMVQKLRESAVMMQRIDGFLPVFLKTTRDEVKLRELVEMRFSLFQQVNHPNLTPVENFSITTAELDNTIKQFSDQFSTIMNKVNPAHSGNQQQQQNQQPSMANGQPQPQQAQNANSQNQQPNAKGAQPQKLNAANLQQQQEALLAQRARSASHQNTHKPPAAPTTSHAPFSFGAQSPQGVPLFYKNENELTQDKLRLPVAKKRKGNQAASASPPETKTQTPGAKSSPLTKVESPEAQRPLSMSSLMKCTVAGCSVPGFATKSELEKHVKESHPPKDEDIEDPMQFFLESLQFALNLDSNGQPKPVEPKPSKESLQAPAMKPSGSTQSQNIKQEVATPMSRTLTGTGPSPSSNLLKTPQPTSTVKTPASDTKVNPKDAAVAKGKAGEEASPAPDPWANSRVSLEWFQEVFGQFRNLNNEVDDDFLAEWAARNPAPPMTPSTSTDTKPSPRKSDVSANDNLDIKISASKPGADESGQPPDWDDLWTNEMVTDLATLDMEGLLNVDIDMDWSDSFDEQLKVDDGPSDEWLKVYAVDKWEEKVKARKKGVKR